MNPSKNTRGARQPKVLPTSGAGCPRDTANDVTVKSPMEKFDSRLYY